MPAALWMGSVLVAAALSLVLTIVLIPVLNRRFDPDWMGRRWSSFEASWQPFFGFMRALNYGGAVASRLIARRLFGDPGYDFRARVGSFTYGLCRLQQLAGLYFVLAGIGSALFL